MRLIYSRFVATVAWGLVASLSFTATAHSAHSATLVDRSDGYVDAHGVMIYYESIGRGVPFMILHGGPGSSHGYFLPHLLPLAAHRRLVFIDERGSGRSQRLSESDGYTLDNMVNDVEAVRVALGLGKMDVMGHSFGGILAQAYAIRHPESVRHLILASTGSSAARINADFAAIKTTLEPGLRKRIEELEAQGIIDASGAQLPEYRKLADQAEAPYSYRGRPPAWDLAGEEMGWDALREIWGPKSDFHIDGNLAGFDFTPALKKLNLPAMVIYGDHDLLTDATAKESAEALKHSRLVRIADCGHSLFVDQTTVFLDAVSAFLDGR